MDFIPGYFYFTQVHFSNVQCLSKLSEVETYKLFLNSQQVYFHHPCSQSVNLQSSSTTISVTTVDLGIEMGPCT